jgi:hypothetical protein
MGRGREPSHNNMGWGGGRLRGQNLQTEPGGGGTIGRGGGTYTIYAMMEHKVENNEIIKTNKKT